MALPSRPINLTAQQVDELKQKLSNLRHDINNHLSLMIAAIELLRTKPHLAERMMATLVEQPPKVASALGKFSADFEKVFGEAGR